jgi:hypothetical protein
MQKFLSFLNTGLENYESEHWLLVLS